MKRDLVCSHWTTAGVAPSTGGASRWPIADRVRACANAGYVGFGLQINDYRAICKAGIADVELKAILDDHGMRHIEIEFLQNWYADGETGEQSRRDEKLLYHMAETFGARVMMTTGELAPDITRTVDELAEKFAGLGRRATEHGVRIGVEVCAFSNIGTPAAAAALISASGAVNAGIYLDVWHLYRAGIGHDSLHAIDPAMIAGIQIGDAAPAVRGTLREDSSNSRLLPGQGTAGVAAFLAVLNAGGYAGPVAVEILSDAQRALPLRQAAQLSYQAACGVIADAGSVSHGDVAIRRR